MTSQADVLPLEKSEGTRLPRNEYELNAQAYMVGNCAHCHNPRGFPVGSSSRRSATSSSSCPGLARTTESFSSRSRR